MSDPVTIFAAAKVGFDALQSMVGALKEAKAYSDPKQVREKLQEIASKAADLKETVLTLRESLNDKREELLTLREDIQSKDKRIKELEDEVAGKVQTEYELNARGIYEKDGFSYCPSCFPKIKRLVRPNEIFLDHVCPSCGFKAIIDV